MGLFLKLTDAVLFLFFLVIALVAPAFDAQACLPATAFPELLVSLKATYARHYGDYLMEEKPHFFVGLVWLELIFLCPLCLVNLYALLTGKPWFRTTCLVQGASVFTSMVAIMSELLNSGKASEKLITMYSSFLGFGLLALLRGLVTSSSGEGKRTVVGRKKRLEVDSIMFSNLISSTHDDSSNQCLPPSQDDPGFVSIGPELCEDWFILRAIE